MLIVQELAMAEQVKIRMTMQEFIERYEAQPFEFVRNEANPILTEIFGHVTVRHVIYDSLRLNEKASQSQSVEIFQRTAFVILDVEGMILRAYTPDVICFNKARLRQYEADNPKSDDKPFMLVPDLLIEVISPNDSYSKMTEKIETYLSDGVRLLWIVDPQRKTVTVYEGSTTSQTLHVADSVSGSSVLPGFKLSVKDIFG
jgi:Uma2 family endonuclease